tara:strand:+ start:29030 stop:29917 length:888 start_codon:yes stop_codon:yes gene_type:complete
MSNNGVCFFAYNNKDIDYVKLALLSALYVKKFMKNNNTCLITEQGDYDYLCQSRGQKLVDKAFDEIVMTNVQHKENMRLHFDSPWSKFTSEFKNSNKHLISEYSPFDKTLLLDIDYFVRNDSLDYLFDSDSSVAMYQQARNLKHENPFLYERYLNPVGIPMWWSTVVYFDKSEISDMFFDIWAHVSENYDFYKFLYNFPGSLFRTDYCVSIAVHLMNGMKPGDIIDIIQNTHMVYMDQKDDLVDVKGTNDWIFLANDRETPWKDITTRNYHDSIHMMNKRSVDRNWQNLLGVLDG